MTSLYIPHVFPNFGKEFIQGVFDIYGDVSEIDLVAKQDRNGKDYNSVYVHFKEWYTTPKTEAFYNTLVDPNTTCRVYYDKTWYWIVLPNTAKKHIPGDRKQRIAPCSSAMAVSSSNVAPANRSYANAVKKHTITEDHVQRIAPRSSAKAVSSSSGAPAKGSYSDAVKKSVEDEETDAEIRAQMDEIDEFLEKEDENLITIDGRYVREMEEYIHELEMDNLYLQETVENFPAQPALTEDDVNIVRIDGRYANQLKLDNYALNTEVATLRMTAASLRDTINELTLLLSSK